MRVSIIVPAYNSRETIGHTLRSLQAQTIVTWEAIVVDDGSSDDTATVVQNFIYSDSRISLVQQSN